MSKTVIDTETLEKILTLGKVASLVMLASKDMVAHHGAESLLSQGEQAIKDSMGLRIFTKEEVAALEKHFDLGAFFEE
ncbi:hypothetical protein VspSw1_59 [Vibrio phage VspSw_1]|uniref:Uncharacterized protein n=1 Tax=Vibrio phage VspSw_1 TaxID=2484249 RepID=A0A411BKQ3_9CAUD|nr:hypothetical protein HOV08_gp059 [Vibrio phage VspSw_1]QAY02132.1 hypothetical protein VspSw1_59 [Vibrio phage VspSw_1]